MRAATDDDLDAVVAVLTAAFHDDPLMSWAFPDAALRPRRLAALWGFMGREGYLPYGASTLVPGGDGADAAALWLAPGQELDDAFWESRGHAFAVALEYDLDRMSSIGSAMAAHHPTEPHWYLHGDRGVTAAPGRAARQRPPRPHARHRRRVARHPPTSKPRAPARRILYERVGFVVTGEFAAPGGPPIWAMWREPA